MRYSDFTKKYILKAYQIMLDAVDSFSNETYFSDAFAMYGKAIEKLDWISIAIPNRVYDSIKAFLDHDVYSSIKKWQDAPFFDDDIGQQFAIDIKVMVENFGYKELQPLLTDEDIE